MDVASNTALLAVTSPPLRPGSSQRNTHTHKTQSLMHIRCAFFFPLRLGMNFIIITWATYPTTALHCIALLWLVHLDMYMFSSIASVLGGGAAAAGLAVGCWPISRITRSQVPQQQVVVWPPSCWAGQQLGNDAVDSPTTKITHNSRSFFPFAIRPLPSSPFHDEGAR